MLLDVKGIAKHNLNLEKGHAHITAVLYKPLSDKAMEDNVVFWVEKCLILIISLLFLKQEMCKSQETTNENKQLSKTKI